MIECSTLPHLLENLVIGGPTGSRTSSAFLQTKRRLEESRLRSIHQRASYSFDIMDSTNSQTLFSGCQFLDVRQNGRALLGCWSVESDRFRQSRIISYRISVDAKEAQKHLRNRAEHMGDCEDKSERIAPAKSGFPSGNSYGLCFVPFDSDIYINATLVDMTIAPVDSDVTAVLYATVRSSVKPNCANTYFNIHLRAIDVLSPEDVRQRASAPIYNVNWSVREPVWSCAFDSNNMRISVGMEKCATIYNVLTNKHFRVSSGKKDVISQQFVKSGDLLFLGRLNADICTLDLRMRQNHNVGEFEDSQSTCFIHQMEDRPNYILTDNFDGKMKMFDIRFRRCVLQFNGHRNSSHKVPCYVDEDERFVFAVGEDGVARGWSLATGGDPICQLFCPQSVSSHGNSDFPRVVYSSRWGGLNGNSAVMFAVNGEIHVHELTLD